MYPMVSIGSPELYQLRKLERERKTPKAGKDVDLMDGMKIVLEKHVPQLKEQGVQFAVASRTKSVEWAHSYVFSVVFICVDRKSLSQIISFLQIQSLGSIWAKGYLPLHRNFSWK